MKEKFAVLTGLLLAACATAPEFASQRIVHTHYDGVADDLLTAGLGRTGLAVAKPPVVTDPKNPTAAELRRLSIHANYRALNDMTPGGGYGRFYGPNIDLAGNDTLGEGKVAGDEYLTMLEGVTYMVQVPERFSAQQPCIVTATSSGSRGVYGAIGTAGEWGLKRGCAVAYTDKGTGTGLHDLDSDTVNLMRGERARAERAGADSNFTASLSPETRSKYLRDFPHRVAMKHAHSQRNPEKDWGRNTLTAIEFAFHVLNGLKDQHAGSYTPDNTLVIASSVSNGGYAALAAAEQDTRGLIDAVAVSEPNVSLAGVPSTLDASTLINIFEPCASLSEANAKAPLNTVPQALREARCASLAKKGLLKSSTLAEQAAESQRIINDYGILADANALLPSHYTLSVQQGIAVTYANSYGRFGVEENLCGYSFAATAASGESAGQAISASGLELSFATSNGIPPTAGINVLNNLSPGGAREERLSASPSSGARDMNLDGALCLRSLVTGVDAVTGQALHGDMLEKHTRVRRGLGETQMRGNLRGKPAIVVTGRADAILPPNFASRAYVARNKAADQGSQLRYYEVTNAHHLDVLNGIPGFDARYIPLNIYYIQALNLMWEHLKSGRPLPPSQVVHTSARGQEDGKTIPLARSNVPAIEQSPAPNNLISIGVDGRLLIPE